MGIKVNKTPLAIIVDQFNIIDTALFSINGKLSYNDTTQAIIELAVMLAEYQGDTEDWLYIGECGIAAMDDLITGAYWHYSEWYGGGLDNGYKALCALGQIYWPNLETVDTKNPAYMALNDAAWSRL